MPPFHLLINLVGEHNRFHPKSLVSALSHNTEEVVEGPSSVFHVSN